MNSGILSALDREIVSDLLDICQGEQGFLQKQYQDFFSLCSVNIEMMQACLPTDDWERLRSCAHATAGSAAVMGARSIMRMCRQLEDMIIYRQGSGAGLEELTRLLRSLEREATALRHGFDLDEIRSVIA